MQSQHWMRNFKVDQEDIEFITGKLLEGEKPLDTAALAQILIEENLRKDADQLREKYKDASLYNPSSTYEIGQRLIFPAMEFSTGNVVAVRPGNNPAYEHFSVVTVEMEDDEKKREFATELTAPHQLSQQVEDEDSNYGVVVFTPEEILASNGDDILYVLETALSENDSLVQLAGKWFPRELILEVNEGHLNLAEAVLDINEGGPLATAAVLQEIGGLGSGSSELQIFSMNYAMREDSRFDEVGPTGEVLWYLQRLEPAEVRETPEMLKYPPIEYDNALLSNDLTQLEREIGDEFSDIQLPNNDRQEATVTLIYPHRRLGTLPLNAAMRQVFPTSRQTPRIAVTLIDGQDGEAYPAWVVRKDRYIYGLDMFYRKHRLPIGAYVTVRRTDEQGKVVVDFQAYRARTEWIRLIVPKNNQLTFENHKRAIGAEYDDLMILGADDIEGVDRLFEITQQQKRTLFSILRVVVPGLGRLTPQGTAHAKTIYSAVNAVKRCPPGPIFATLVASPEFENVGGHYWKLSDDQER
ncbi:MAG: hypothetical protein K8L99_05400 [Anaerolineae bacterium]|nr:hypothetical protein [Anaerolineae bacterium]